MKAFAAACLAAAAALIAPALANDTVDVLTSGAVLELQTPETTYTVSFNDDGSYTTSLDGVEGTWEMSGGELCATRSTGETTCGPIPAGMDVGDSWTDDATGVTYTILEG